ncbi:MAG: PAS domain S-box protein [Blastocatellia bacterium]|nr:PAS domain S-box protein [Blastocatellia bacterium]
MNKVLTGWSLIWLVVTVLFVAGGALNLSERMNRPLPPTDGVMWVQKSGGVHAEKVLPGFAGARAGISPGDKLLSISLDGETFDEVIASGDVQMYLEAAGVGGNLTYHYQKQYSFANNLYFSDLTGIDSVPRWTASLILLAIVGLVWLGVGMFVLFKQGSRSPFVLHFATLCLAAFVFHVYAPLGLARDFDLAVQLLDTMAFAFFVALFMHFCLRYPVRSEVIDKKPWKTYLLYAPATLIVAAHLVFFLSPFILPEAWALSLISFLDRNRVLPLLNQALLIHFVAGISTGAGLLFWRYMSTPQALVRQRLKWAMFGTIVSILPILGFQIARRFIYLPEDTLSAALTTLPLALIPLSFGHSVVRYRLMDVDVVVRRALVYAMTTMAIAMMVGGVALGLVFLAVGNNLSSTEIALRALIAVIAMAGIIMLSEPLKNFLQERANRYFYGERYDLRQGLLDFGRTLSATTAMGPLLDALTERLVQVLDVEKVAVFIEDERNPEKYQIAKAIGLSNDYQIPKDFKNVIRTKSATTGVVRADEVEFFDGGLTGTSSNGNGNGNGSKLPVRQELHYYVPCVVRSKMVAMIGLGRASDGSLLSSEDLEILKALAGYIAVAIENARLYQEQQSHTEELALLKEFNESIIESVNVGLLAVDENGRVTRCNGPFEDMFTMSRDEVVGRVVEEIFDEDFAANLSTILGKHRWHLTEIRNAYKLPASDAFGQPLMMNVAVAPLRSVTTEQTGAIIVFENVTARVKLEENLQQNEKLSSIGLLAAGVAHEVNTPLTGVSSYTQMLLGMVPETDPKHALLQKMQRQTERATDIVGNLLNFSRTGNATEWAEVDINQLMEDTMQLLEPQFRSSGIEIEKKYAAAPPRILASAGKLQQVFTNLIINARDAVINGGTISLCTFESESGEVIIEVSDDGVGIPAENLNKIFDPFFTTKGVGNGTGLGLAVTYGIVQEHSGTIEARSREGGGTTFRLVFPAATTQRQRIAG